MLKAERKKGIPVAEMARKHEISTAYIICSEAQCLKSVSKLTAEVFTSSLAGRSAMTQRPVFAGSVVPREPTEVAIMGFRNGLC